MQFSQTITEPVSQGRVYHVGARQAEGAASGVRSLRSRRSTATTYPTAQIESEKEQKRDEGNATEAREALLRRRKDLGAKWVTC